MSRTTWILMDHIPEPLARLAESFLIGDGDDYGGRTEPQKIWSDIAIGEHMEFIMKVLNRPSKGEHLADLLIGFCSTGNIEMIQRAIKSRTVFIEYEKRHHREYYLNHRDELKGLHVNDLNHGLTAAIEHRQVAAARLMVSHGATIVITEYSTLNIEDVVSEGNSEMCSIIKDAGGMDREMFIRHAEYTGNTHLIDLLGETTNAEKRLIFTYSCMNNRVEHAQSYLANVPSEHLAARAAYGLRYAAIDKGNEDVARFLLEQNADPNRGMTAACEQGVRNITAILIAAGATECGCGKSISEHTPDYGRKRKREAKDEEIRKYREKLDKILGR